MRTIALVFTVCVTLTLLHNIYLFNTEVDEDDGFGEEMINTDLQIGTVAVLSKFLSSSIRRVKRRIFYYNESLPELDPSLYGNRTGRNHTVSLIKLLNKNYFIIKKRYEEMINKTKWEKEQKFNAKKYRDDKLIAAKPKPAPAAAPAAATTGAAVVAPTTPSS